MRNGRLQRVCATLVALALLLIAAPLSAQIEDAKAAIDRGEYVRAVNLLSGALSANPTADVYLYLGIAYSHMREWDRAESLFKEGAKRFKDDPRFYNELADLYLTNNEPDRSKEALEDVLDVDATNVRAADLLATIEMSQGDVKAALHHWNKIGRPIVDDIQHNSHLTFGHWTIKQALALHPESVLRYEQWRTTELRLLETGLFTSAALEIEPTPTPNRYSVNIHTLQHSNSPESLAFNLLKGAPVKTSYLDVWNLGNSGVSVRSKYRWDANRRLGQAQLLAPLPLPGILFLDAAGAWRSEQWDVSSQLQTNAGPDSRFRYKSTGAGMLLKHIPTHWLEIGAGVEYVNRYASGGLPAFLENSLNAAKILAETAIRPADGRYQNRLYAQVELARRGFLGQLNYTTGTVELNNRLPLSAKNALNWTIKGGASSGSLPVDEYFQLGVDTESTNLLRGHSLVHDGRYGNAPMATSFVLANTEFERRLARLPLFSALSLPYLELKAEVFLDVAHTWDSTGLFKVGTYVDTGVGLKFVTPTRSLNLTYGRALRDPDNVFKASVEKRW